MRSGGVIEVRLLTDEAPATTARFIQLARQGYYNGLTFWRVVPGLYLQGGLVEVALLGGAQIDRFGNLNTTVIGDYERPKVRLPGSGGACEIAINARQVFVIMRQSKRSFVEAIDFRTSAGNLGGAADSERIRREQGWLGRGPSVVVTDLGIWHFDEGGEMRLDSVHPGASLEDVRAATAWEPKIARGLATTPPPTDAELRLIREELDPGGAYTS